MWASKGTSWARARLATRDFLARPAGGPHDLSANGARRSGTKSGARVAAAAQVLGMGHVRAIPTSHALTSPTVAPLAARATTGATTRFLFGASRAGTSHVSRLTLTLTLTLCAWHTRRL